MSMGPASIVVAGAFDTKGEEYRYVRDSLRELGLPVTMVDVGTRGIPSIEADVSRREIMGPVDQPESSAGGARGEALELMSEAFRVWMRGACERGEVRGAFGMGGSGAVALLAPAFREVPLGVPKLIATTMASSSGADVVGASDLLLVPSIVDIAGLNSISRFVLDRCVAILASLDGQPPMRRTSRPTVGATMFGVTTVAVDAARLAAELNGDDVIVVHANGVGGRTLEALARGGWLDAVLDLTTSELLDELVGGVASAGPDRLRAATDNGIAQVVSVGGCDIINFGPPQTVPRRFRDRSIYQHGPTATLVRSSVDECEQLGHVIADRLSGAHGGVTVLLPERGLSALSAPGGPFDDPRADSALIDTLERRLSGSVAVERFDGNANDVEFGRFAAALLERLRRPQPMRRGLT
jgi:uncharacterized protein (UPF0261 family)